MFAHEWQQPIGTVRVDEEGRVWFAPRSPDTAPCAPESDETGSGGTDGAEDDSLTVGGPGQFWIVAKSENDGTVSMALECERCRTEVVKYGGAHATQQTLALTIEIFRRHECPTHPTQ